MLIWTNSNYPACGPKEPRIDAAERVANQPTVVKFIRVMPQVHPTAYANSEKLPKLAALRGEACLEGDSAGDMHVDTDGAAVEWSQRSEFDLLLDFLDTDGNGKVSALELADFVDSLLGTQDHKRPNGSIVFEAVLTSALRHASAEKEKGNVATRPGGQRPPPPPLPPPPPPRPPLPTSSLTPKDGGSGKWTSSQSDGDGAATASKQQHQHRASSSQLTLQRQQSQKQPQQVASGALSAALGSPLASVSMREVHVYGSSRFLSMDAVRRCFADLLADTDLWIRLTGSCSVMTTTLFRQLLMYSAERLERKFSMGVFLRTYAAFNTLPLWLPFPALWRTPRNGTLFLVYLHQLTKLQQQLGPTISSRLPLHTTLLLLTLLQFTATYVPLIAFISTNAISAIRSSNSIVDFMHANPLAYKVSLFGSILPCAVLQFLTSSAALKLSCRDFVNLKEQCKAVFMLGDVSSEFEGYRGLTMRQLMDAIKARVELNISRSSYRRLNALMPLLFSLALETFRRLVRLFLVRNLVARERMGVVLAPFEVYALVYNIWFAYSESADCTAYLYKLRKISSVFKTLLSKEESLSQSLPWLNNHSPRNLLMWSRLRRYYQSPNCLELRWIEMHLTLVVVAAIAITIILVVTFVQKTLLRFAPENADLQLFMVWVIPAFCYLLLALVIDVIMSASTGVEYHDAVMTLSAESVFIADRLNSAEEIARRRGEVDEEEEEQEDGAVDSDDSDDDKGPSAAAAAAAGASGSVCRKSASSAPPSALEETGLVRRVTGATGSAPEEVGGLVSEPGGGGGGRGARAGGGGGRAGGSSRSGSGSGCRTSGRRRGSGGLERAGSRGQGYWGGDDEVGGWVPAAHYRLSRSERTRLRQCQQVIKSLVSYIQFNAEYITIFGVPIDTHLRNTLFSVSVTLVGAGVSAFLAIVVKRG
ncbi:hypothetical protein PLESTF_000709000 [Pleodorina starrii]|nr:hypothetical protein PLESTM_001798300 [Pleodorina starrii]GLC68562.1 hypothetical protein PLESTF_000709000 [Pleodorina starrii]